MILSRVEVRNFRCIEDIKLDLSDFLCMVGKNSSGKSTLLRAIQILRAGPTMLRDDDFHSAGDVVFECVISEITDDDLLMISPEHRKKIEAILIDRELHLVRRYSPSTRGESNTKKRVPKEERFKKFKDLPGSYKEMKQDLCKTFPEIEKELLEATTKQAAADLIAGLAAKQPIELTELEESKLETGIHQSIINLFPDIILIEAVKDLEDEFKTKDASVLGKILKLILEPFRTQEPNFEAALEAISRKLSRFTDEHGIEQDERVPIIQDLERRVQQALSDVFKEATLKLVIPPPELKTLLATARFEASDGVNTSVERKGDGFKRALIFALLQALADLSKLLSEQRASVAGRNLILFEEPEIYLHPSAQTILFEALRTISRDHQVLITTHSPFFLAAGITGFARVFKRLSATSQKPATQIRTIDLSQLREKDLFQLISFETNNAAFFADTIVLVEGDSDLIAYPHISRLCNEDWQFSLGSVALIWINGKGSIRRFKQFFSRFDQRVCAILDLDVIINGFELLEMPGALEVMRSKLIQALDEVAGVEVPIASYQETKAQASKVGQRQLFDKLCEIRALHHDGKATSDDLAGAITDFFVFERNDPRFAVLAASKEPEIANAKFDLLQSLRAEDIFVLSKGEIEDYYPPTLSGDKVQRALNFSTTVADSAALFELCPSLEQNGIQMPEFEIIFGHIFNDRRVPLNSTDNVAKL